MSVSNCLLLLSIVHPILVQCSNNLVTCGSVLKLQHVRTNVRLHSHEVSYGSGSGQQSVTGITHADDVNSYWLVRGKHGEHCKRGEPIKCDDTVSLQHVQTHKNLHSHLFSSPLSHNQEVSAFDGEDSGDDWVVECSTTHWKREESVKFKHLLTGVYLQCSGHQYGRPIAGQKEISGTKYPNQDAMWKALEGVYLKPSTKNA